MKTAPILLFLVFLAGCSARPEPLVNPFAGPSPWPDIRAERIRTLLPDAMARNGIDVWLVVCRENSNDPLADFIGGENAGGTAVFLFERSGDGVRSLVFSPIGEATALRDVGLHDSVAVVARGASAIRQASDYLIGRDPARIAINRSGSNELADGLSSTQYEALIEALGPALSRRLVSSEDLVDDWLAIKLPAEVEIMRQAAALTAAWQLEAYATIVPGETTDADVARFLKAKMAAYGVTDAWAPDQNPNVNSGPDRGHSHSTDRVIRAGDVIQTDFGIRVFGRWVTDIQRFAYVLGPGETAPPDSIQGFWSVAKEGVRRVHAAMKPGVSGYEVDKVQREWLRANGSLPVMWSTGHPVGYVAHDAGPGLGGAQEGRTPAPFQLKTLRPGMTFAYDGFFAWRIPEGTKTISVEEMVVITETGAEFLIPPQEELVLIRSK